MSQPVRVRRRRWALSPLDFLEPLLLLVVGFFALAPERFAPRLVLIALATLLAPYLLRWLFYGAPSRSTPAALPLALLLLVLTPLSRRVSPYFWETSWPELVRMVWGGAVCLAVLNWAQPLWGQRSAHPGAGYRIPRRFWFLTAGYLVLGLGLGGLGLLNMQIVTKIPGLDQAAHYVQSYKAASDITLSTHFNPNRVAAVLVLVAPLPLAFLLGRGRRRPPAAVLPRPSPAESEETTVAIDAQLSTSPGGAESSARPAGAPPVTANSQRRSRRALRWLGGTLGRLLSKLFWLALWLILAVGLVLTQSRAGLVATAVSLLVVAALTVRQPGGGRRLLQVSFVLLLGMGIGYSLLPPPVLAHWQSGLLPEAQTGRTLDTNSLQARMIIWERALNGLADQPLTGMGLAAFDRIAQEPYPLPRYKPGNFHHAHNLFLQVALDFGVPGVLVFMAVVVVTAHALIVLYRTVPPAGYLAVWTVGMLGCFAAFVVYNSLDALTLGARPAVVLWFWLGLALAARNLVPVSAGQQAVTHPR